MTLISDSPFKGIYEKVYLKKIRDLMLPALEVKLNFIKDGIFILKAIIKIRLKLDMKEKRLPRKINFNKNVPQRKCFI